MAEGLARHFLGHTFDVLSAGSRPAEKVHPMAVAVLAEVGIDISHQKSKSISDIDLSKVDVVIALCAEEECPLLPPTVKKLNWPMINPVDNTVPGEIQIKKFRKVRDELRKKLHEYEDAQRFYG